jgi:hypothetical protein
MWDSMETKVNGLAMSMNEIKKLVLMAKVGINLVLGTKCSLPPLWKRQIQCEMGLML